MAITYVKSGTHELNGVASIAVTLATISAGSLIVVWVKHEGAPVTITVSDGTTSLTAAGKTNHTNNDLSGAFFYLPAAVATGSVTYTATLSASRGFVSIIAFEYTYGDTIVLDQENSSATNASGTSHATGNITTTGTDEVVLVGYGEYVGAIPTAELINGVAPDHVIEVAHGVNYTQAFDKIFTATFTGQGTQTQSNGAYILRIISFKTTTGGGGGGRIMSGLARHGGLASHGGLAGSHGGLAG